MSSTTPSRGPVRAEQSSGLCNPYDLGESPDIAPWASRLVVGAVATTGALALAGPASADVGDEPGGLDVSFDSNLDLSAISRSSSDFSTADFSSAAGELSFGPPVDIPALEPATLELAPIPPSLPEPASVPLPELPELQAEPLDPVLMPPPSTEAATDTPPLAPPPPSQGDGQAPTTGDPTLEDAPPDALPQLDTAGTDSGNERTADRAGTGTGTGTGTDDTPAVAPPAPPRTAPGADGTALDLPGDDTADVPEAEQPTDDETPPAPVSTGDTGPTGGSLQDALVDGQPAPVPDAIDPQQIAGETAGPVTPEPATAPSDTADQSPPGPSLDDPRQLERATTSQGLDEPGPSIDDSTIDTLSRPDTAETGAGVESADTPADPPPTPSRPAVQSDEAAAAERSDDDGPPAEIDGATAPAAESTQTGAGSADRGVSDGPGPGEIPSDLEFGEEPLDIAAAGADGEFTGVEQLLDGPVAFGSTTGPGTALLDAALNPDAEDRPIDGPAAPEISAADGRDTPLATTVTDDPELLDLGPIAQLDPVPAVERPEPTDTEPTDTEPTDTEPTDTEPTDTEEAEQITSDTRDGGAPAGDARSDDATGGDREETGALDGPPADTVIPSTADVVDPADAVPAPDSGRDEDEASTQPVEDAPAERDTAGLGEATRAGAIAAGAAVAADIGTEIVTRTVKGAAGENLGRTRTPREQRAVRALLTEPIRALADSDVRAALVSRSAASRIVTEVGYGLAGIPLHVGAGAVLGPAGAPVAAGAAKALQTEVIGPRVAELFAEEAASPVLAGPDGRMYRRGDTPPLVNPLREPTTSGPIDNGVLTTVDGAPLRGGSSVLVTSDGRPLTERSPARRLLDRVLPDRERAPQVLGADGRPLADSAPDSPPAVLGADGERFTPQREGSVLRPRQPAVLEPELREFLDAAPRQEAAALAGLGIPDLDDLTTRTPDDVAPRRIVSDAVAETRGVPVAREAAEAINRLPDGIDAAAFTRTGGTANPPRRLRPTTLPAVAGEVTKNALRLVPTAAGVPLDLANTVGALANACSGALCSAAGKGVEQLLQGGTRAVSSGRIRTSAGADALSRLAEAAVRAPENLLELGATVAAGSVGAGYLTGSRGSLPVPGGPSTAPSVPAPATGSPASATTTPTPRRIPTGAGAVVASVVAPAVENRLRTTGVLPSDPLQEGWRGQAVNVASRAGVGCLSGLTSRADCLTGAALEASDAFFDETTAGQAAARFAETEYDGNPLRERTEAAVSVPINQARLAGAVGDVAGNAVQTTGQVIGTGLAYAYDLVNGGTRMPAVEYLQNLEEMGGAPATRAALSETVELLGRIDQRRRQIVTGVPDRDENVDSPLDARSRERSGLPICDGPSEIDCIEPDSIDPSDPNSVGSARVGTGGSGVRVTDARTGRTSQFPLCTTSGQIDCIPESSIDRSNPNSVGTVRRGDGRASFTDGSGREVAYPDCEVLGQVQCVVGNELRVGTGAPTRTNGNGQVVEAVTYEGLRQSARASTYTGPPARTVTNPVTRYRAQVTDAVVNQAQRLGNGAREAARNVRSTVQRGAQAVQQRAQRGVQAVRNAVGGAVDRVRQALPWNR